MNRRERRAARRTDRSEGRLVLRSEGELLSYLRGDVRGRVLHALVLHDDGCTRVSCRCQPHYEVRAGTAANIREGERLESEWIARTAS